MIKSFKIGNVESCSERDTLECIERILLLHSYETSDLIHQYYLDRYKQQQTMESTPHGQLTVRCGFTDDSFLEVSISESFLSKNSSTTFSVFFSTSQIEIINARNLVPLSSNGSCDPFVRIYLSPEEKFGTTAKFKTNVQYKTIYPLFDEKFLM